MNREDLERVKKYILDTNEGVNVIIQGDKMWLVLLSSGHLFQLSDVEVDYQLRQSRIIRVKASKLLRWVYSDDYDALGYHVVEELLSNGKFSINVKEVFDSVGYIPSSIVENYTFEDERDFDTDDVQLIDDVTK